MGLFVEKRRLIGAAAGVSISLACAPGKAEPKSLRSAATSVQGLSLEATTGFSGDLTRDEGDVVTTMGRLGPTSVVASTKKGYAFTIDTKAGTVTKQSPLVPVKDQNSYLFTVSKKYVWEFATSTGTVGRNKNAASSTQVTINKADIKDLESDMTALVPVAATESQLYLLSADSILVFTWSDGALGRQKVRINRSFGADELIMGAGAMNEAAPDKAFWLATSKKLMIFKDGTWTEQNFSTRSSQGTVEYISLYFKSESDKEPADELIGLLDSGRLTSMKVVQSQGTDVATNGNAASGEEAE